MVSLSPVQQRILSVTWRIFSNPEFPATKIQSFQKSTRSRPMERLRQPFTAAARTKTKKQPKMPFRGNLLDDDGGGCFLPQRVGSDFWKLGSSKHTHFTQIFYISICTCIYVEMPTPTHAKSVFIVSYIYTYIHMHNDHVSMFVTLSPGRFSIVMNLK